MGHRANVGEQRGCVKARLSKRAKLGYPRNSVKTALLAFATCVAVSSPARGGEAACWFENGVVVVTAEVAGVVGDYILDTGQPQTQLAETQALGAGYEANELLAEVRLAGVTIPARTVAVADLDVRTGLLPTPIAGIIGTDVLKGLVLDLRFAPCRLALNPADHAPPFRRARAVPLAPAASGLMGLRATVSDGLETRSVVLVPSTGSDAPVRLSEALASAPVGDAPQELYPYGVRRPKLGSLAFAGQAWNGVPAGLLKVDAGVDGWIGAPVLYRFRVRFDFARGRLELARP